MPEASIIASSCPIVEQEATNYPNYGENAMAEEAANVHATSALPDDLRESVAAANLKCVAEVPSVLSNLATADAVTHQRMTNQNALSHQQAMNAISVASVGKVVELISATSPAEGGVDIAALMQIAKMAQTTPPVTA
jgi:hypothetical protein